jgi:hypothetical protein
MSRYLLLTAVVLCGCSSAPEDLRPFVAVAGRYSMMTDAKPAPAIKTDCSNCRGLGYLSDGRVRSECPICKGTGKVVSSSAPCKDGTCPPDTKR